ncbi:hypothetical protein JRQ81_010996 [Phrynocephalus forsythii]|uniref:Uncharacterized protein n=1 Tax=Phrynocephalus forsythii TaxID=171643 RepID=A0A9Q1B4Q0_9SAUR|nr:hypothetical protein JRQ81_010996 [Phrynocephalus forsythii]
MRGCPGKPTRREPGEEEEEEEEAAMDWLGRDGSRGGSRAHEGESDDLTDSEESVFSGLEDSGSDSLTEEEEEEEDNSRATEEDDGDHGVEKSKGQLLSENAQSCSEKRGQRTFHAYVHHSLQKESHF